MDKDKIHQVVEKQRDFFLSGKTKDPGFRIEQLEKLRLTLGKYENDMIEAARKDAGRADVETYFMEANMNMDELKYALKHIKHWVRPKTVNTPMLFFMSKSRIYPEPYGVSLIISAWNYPFLQLFSPLIGAIAAGNTAILKPAPESPHCAACAQKIIRETFPEEYITLIQGDAETTTLLLEESLDYIFFTGSPRIGRIIQAAAAKNLIPITLELGGKSPAVVDESADLDMAAKKIVWAKFFNAGQICVTVDHLYVQENIKDEIIRRCIYWIKKFYGEDASKSSDYGFMINERNFNRVIAFLNNGKLVYGGKHDSGKRYIEPSILDNVSENDPVMQDEIFGPILPVLTYRTIDDFIEVQKRKAKPLSLYVFSKKNDTIAKVIANTSSGGVTVNDCMIHAGTTTLPFGGVGNSGIGNYHGKFTFDAFTHYKSVLKAPALRALDMPIKYPPYKGKLRIIKTLKNLHMF